MENYKSLPTYLPSEMVKHVTIDLDDDIHEALLKLKDKYGLTWAKILIDWKKMKEAEG